MRRRLDLAGALVAAPPVLVLDEPTTGLDPHSRLQMWDVIRELVAAGSTLLLTTQYLEEADRLADDILVIDHGKAIAQGSADQLKASTGGERIEVVLTDPAHRPAAERALAAVSVDGVRVSDNERELTAAVGGSGSADLLRVLQAFEVDGVEVYDVGLRRPTLDDVFLALTGHASEGADTDENGAGA
jgi:ABC-2 type transport system ATP-binding protein